MRHARARPRPRPGLLGDGGMWGASARPTAGSRGQGPGTSSPGRQAGASQVTWFGAAGGPRTGMGGRRPGAGGSTATACISAREAAASKTPTAWCPSIPASSAPKAPARPSGIPTATPPPQQAVRRHLIVLAGLVRDVDEMDVLGLPRRTIPDTGTVNVKYSGNGYHASPEDAKDIASR